MLGCVNLNVYGPPPVRAGGGGGGGVVCWVGPGGAGAPAHRKCAVTLHNVGIPHSLPDHEVIHWLAWTSYGLPPPPPPGPPAPPPPRPLHPHPHLAVLTRPGVGRHLD